MEAGFSVSSLILALYPSRFGICTHESSAYRWLILRSAGEGSRRGELDFAGNSYQRLHERGTARLRVKVRTSRSKLRTPFVPPLFWVYSNSAFQAGPVMIVEKGKASV